VFLKSGTRTLQQSTVTKRKAIILKPVLMLNEVFANIFPETLQI
jgi:hypothetical protein